MQGVVKSIQMFARSLIDTLLNLFDCTSMTAGHHNTIANERKGNNKKTYIV